MSTPFRRIADRLHSRAIARLGDVLVRHYDKHGTPVGESVLAIHEKDAERLSFNGVDRWQTLTLQLSDLPVFDRQGYFVSESSEGKLHIDDIASEDSYAITFYVRAS